MSFNTLKWLRLIGPGLMVAAVLIPAVFYFEVSATNTSALYKAGGPAAAVVFGIVYALLDVRGKLWKAEQRDYVGEQIRRAILELAPKDLKLTVAEEQVIRDRTMGRLGGIFWEAVETDDVLKSHKEHFYSNGFLYSVSFDTLIVGIIAGMGYSLAYYATQYDLFEGVSLFSTFAGLFALFVGIPRSRERHLELSREQLTMLRDRRREFVGEKIAAIITECRANKQ